jgi:hypothetical protein
MVAAMSVTGCDQPAKNGCLPLLGTFEGRDYTAAHRLVTVCVQAQAYRLARSPDPASDVAQAVVGACMDNIESAARAWEPGDDGRRISIHPRTGAEVTSTEAEFEDALLQARFYVVHARAGKCEA